MKKVLRLGTRKSLLAWAQSSLVAEWLEQKHPGVKVSLVGIVTKGDQVTDTPLSKIEGKEFFVKELDDALLGGHVDMTVHSMKDLSTSRPDGIRLAATPPREDPRDIIIFRADVLETLRSGRAISIGTSSPRRLQNIPSFLAQALPQFGDRTCQVRFREIRGNVNTRLSRLKEDSRSERYLDGVVLALAGLSRLQQHASSKAIVTQLLEQTRMMVLPLDYCPASPAQGALAIECRANDAETRVMLATLDDAATVAAVGRERALMAQWGGGCHQKFGITCVDHPELGALLFKRGTLPDQTHIEELEFEEPQNDTEGAACNGMQFRAYKDVRDIDAEQLKHGEPVFVASPAGATEALLSRLAQMRVWCIGTSSWFKLAKRGLWIEGCADGLGVDHIMKTLGTPVLNLLPLDRWTILTHTEAGGTWSFGKVLSPYSIRYEATDDIKEQLKTAKHIYWSSGSQFQTLGKFAHRQAVHACGAGKTAKVLRGAGVQLLNVFPSVQAWEAWIQQRSKEQS